MDATIKTRRIVGSARKQVDDVLAAALSRLAYHFVSITRLQRAMRRQAVINRASGTTTGSSLWRIVMPHFAKASAADTASVATVGLILLRHNF